MHVFDIAFHEPEEPVSHRSCDWSAHTLLVLPQARVVQVSGLQGLSRYK